MNDLFCFTIMFEVMSLTLNYCVMSSSLVSLYIVVELTCSSVSLFLVPWIPSRMNHGVEESRSQEVVMRRVHTLIHTPGFKRVCLCL